jgi:hypothetical protein
MIEFISIKLDVSVDFQTALQLKKAYADQYFYHFIIWANMLNCQFFVKTMLLPTALVVWKALQMRNRMAHHFTSACGLAILGPRWNPMSNFYYPCAEIRLQRAQYQLRLDGLTIQPRSLCVKPDPG